MKLSFAVSAGLIGSAAAWSSMSMKSDIPSSAATSRREIFQKGAAAVFGLATAANAQSARAYDLPDLPYAFEALEPYIDAPTMKIHHDKHHATYVANLNKATEGKEAKPILDLMEDAIAAGPAVRNNGGGHYNHAFFWEELAPADQAAKTKPSEQLLSLINKSFGSLDEMKAQFEARAAPGALFGSGWVWICVNQAGDALKLVGTPNQDNPLMKGAADEIMFPILGLDVWEHAYYLKYQNRRPEYVSNFWNLVNWDKVSQNCAYVIEKHAGVPF
ncbi:superoxide dismutase, Fe-Mn family [Fistulifera solaris]|uniref:Superoxide dismutase [Fe] n=1 Tax=Fistulifera solaris TaxID=1519565 RepID=A0A1Z5KQA0_FISSO|nr:superoxide dismutase, Fe-Mn family [Fistulifera solaris]|eukprot:GAX28295.1 superoxide dismutase, Fe-Mn family [Fistulifera solaris]